MKRNGYQHLDPNMDEKWWWISFAVIAMWLASFL